MDQTRAINILRCFVTFSGTFKKPIIGKNGGFSYQVLTPSSTLDRFEALECALDFIGLTHSVYEVTNSTGSKRSLFNISAHELINALYKETHEKSERIIPNDLLEGFNDEMLSIVFTLRGSMLLLRNDNVTSKFRSLISLKSFNEVEVNKLNGCLKSQLGFEFGHQKQKAGGSTLVAKGETREDVLLKVIPWLPDSHRIKLDKHPEYLLENFGIVRDYT